MDEQQFQARVALIEQLLACPQGQEMKLLQQNADLVDAELLAVMAQVADYLESQGNGNAARLRQFAAQLAQAMGLETTTPLGTEAARQFLLETLQLIVDKRGDPQQIYPLWAQHQARFNVDLLAVLPTVAAQLFQGETEQRTFFATVFVYFGNLLQQFPLGTHWLNLELSIAAYEQSLQVMTRDAMPRQWATSMMNLAMAYQNRIHGDRAQNIEDAIAVYKQSLQVRARDAMPVDWAQSMMNLAIAYRNRIRGDRAQNIEDAIAAYEQSLQVMTRDDMPVEWATSMNNLAAAYLDRIRGDRAQNIEEAIAACQQSLQVRTREARPVDWAKSMNNLATAYQDRIRGDRAQNIEEAIAAYEQLLQVMTREAMPVEWATLMMNLATAYTSRIRGDRGQNIEEAIVAYEQSLQVTTREATPVEWATLMMNLANAYASRIRGDRGQNIEEAIAAYEQSLQVTTREVTPIDWATSMMNLATAYASRIRGDRGQNIEEAIAAYEQSLQVITREAMPVDWAELMNNLANAYRKRIRGDQAQNIEDAIAACQQALEIFKPAVLPDYCRRTSRLLANLYSEQQLWDDAAPVYEKALEAAEILYQSATLLDSKSGELRATADLPRRAAYALARTGKLQDAVLTLEQGRARGLSESLERDRADLDQLKEAAPNLHQQYINLASQLRNLDAQQRDRSISDQRHSLTPTELSATAARLSQQRESLLQHIRQVSGYEQFLALPTFADIQKATQPDCPLVYLVSTPSGSLALIITPHTIHELWLNDLNETQLIDLLDQSWFSAYSQSQTNRQAWYDAIDTVTHQLWEPLVAPLIAHLKTHNIPQATLIPTGYLSYLPLHAAWTEDPSTPTGRRYALDDIHFTYAPNAKSLTAAQAIAQRTGADSILAIDNPREDLHNAGQEVAAAVATFPQSKILKHGDASVEAVKVALPDMEIAHFSCHGTANLDSPLTSGLGMSDGLLTLKDIFALNLAGKDQGNDGLRLAILSACETGLSGIENADEAVSLPTGLLQAGVAGVVASLWAVADLSTMLLLTRFYHLWRKEGVEPSLALRQAQQWLRDTTDAEKEAFIPDLMAVNSGSRTYAHPFHWAAFSYTGI
ncbi:MAG: tetratricopeptide repeat protein [Kaiparowitsia implicata GSE-PSE-MK54-09C]|jgi:CHAT domain-containing protein|nr:tetratricopeptide repeat protein [Kaiparowitsia implicata GSE-PSE-MK54-09C]